MLASYVLNEKALQQQQQQAEKAATSQPKVAAARPAAPASASPVTAQGRQDAVRQQIDLRGQGGRFLAAQMVAAMRAQANATASAIMAPAMRQLQASNQCAGLLRLP